MALQGTQKTPENMSEYYRLGLPHAQTSQAYCCGSDWEKTNSMNSAEFNFLKDKKISFAKAVNEAQYVNTM